MNLLTGFLAGTTLVATTAAALTLFGLLRLRRRVASLQKEYQQQHAALLSLRSAIHHLTDRNIAQVGLDGDTAAMHDADRGAAGRARDNG